MRRKGAPWIREICGLIGGHEFRRRQTGGHRPLAHFVRLGGDWIRKLQRNEEKEGIGTAKGHIWNWASIPVRRRILCPNGKMATEGAIFV